MTSARNERNYGQAAMGGLLWLANGINVDVAFVAQGMLTMFDVLCHKPPGV